MAKCHHYYSLLADTLAVAPMQVWLPRNRKQEGSISQRPRAQMKGFWLQDLPHHKYRQTKSVFETNTHKLILPLPPQAPPRSISGTGGLKLKRLCQLFVPCPSQREICRLFNTTLLFTGSADIFKSIC